MTAAEREQWAALATFKPFTDFFLGEVIALIGVLNEQLQNCTPPADVEKVRAVRDQLRALIKKAEDAMRQACQSRNQKLT